MFCLSSQGIETQFLLSPSKICSSFKIPPFLIPTSEKTSTSFSSCVASFNQPSLCQALVWA